jgi:hypothetical protein
MLALTAFLPAAAQTLQKAQSDIPLPPEIMKPQYEAPPGRNFKIAGITVYAAGALYDLYTTKRALDAGLVEGNPLLRSDRPGTTLATAAAAKFVFGVFIGTVGRQQSNHARGAWYLSTGIAQFGYGVHNRNMTIREREQDAAAAAAASAAALGR